MHTSGTKLPAGYFYFHNKMRLNGAGKRREKEGRQKEAAFYERKVRANGFQRARYFIMYVDTKRTRDGR